jgi:hypothetical protein
MRPPRISTICLVIARPNLRGPWLFKFSIPFTFSKVPSRSCGGISGSRVANAEGKVAVGRSCQGAQLIGVGELDR